jgi:hypothetical protein
MDSTVNPKSENNERIRSWGTLLGSQHFGVEGRDGAPGWGLECMINKSITHKPNLHKLYLHKLNNKLVNV